MYQATEYTCDIIGTEKQWDWQIALSDNDAKDTWSDRIFENVTTGKDLH